MWETTKLMNEIKELNEWREFSCSRLGKLNIVNLSILPILGMLLMREALHAWEQGYMGNLCTFASVLL